MEKPESKVQSEARREKPGLILCVNPCAVLAQESVIYELRPVIYDVDTPLLADLLRLLHRPMGARGAVLILHPAGPLHGGLFRAVLAQESVIYELRPVIYDGTKSF